MTTLIMKIVLIGGHLSPALSVLETLPKGTEVLFIGRKYGFEGDNALSLEYKTVTERKIPFVALNTGRLQRKLTKYTMLSLFKLPFGIVKSFFTLIKFKPDVVIGFGGYVSIPVALSAYILRIPIVIHEQTMEVGFANRLISHLATKICISWTSSEKYFPKEKIIFTGRPMRKFQISSIRQAQDKFQIDKRKPLIYITGGSSGSHFINVLIEECAERLLDKYNLIHQTGDSQEFHDYDRLEKLRNSLSVKQKDRYILRKFIDPSEIGDILRRTSLVISRSGINIVIELLRFEKPALLIPLPFSQNNEQLKNAKFLEKLGLGKVLQQSELDWRKLYQAIELMFHNIDNYKIDKKQLKNLQEKKTALNIVDVINYVSKLTKAKVF